jgi:polysaccharide pyruvyl transferase WcaK-like protein
VGNVLVDGLRSTVQWAITSAFFSRPKHKTEPSKPPLRDVMVIGAYGGEHIGDTAILGGVLLRVHQRYGVTRAVLMTQRPAHTRHLVPMLDVPVKIMVEPYEHNRIRECMAQVDAVIFAGGPLMDIPKQLVRHLYAVSLARRKGRPFIAEGIGAGPFPRWPSEWVARRLVKMARRISVRTTDDGQHRLVRGLKPEVGKDPAFDYLQSRGVELTRLPDVDQHWIERLLQETEGRLRIGINIRPIRHLFTDRSDGQDRVAFTRSVEARFEERLADGLRRFDAATAPKPCIIFFPMNAIQFGMSDLRSAYRIRRLLGKDVDFRIWEGDAALDGIVELSRRLDLVIAMRFHAAIFALAQGRRVIGIDYRVGKRDKVAALLSDFDQNEDCVRIDELSSDWLCERLFLHERNHRNSIR